MESLPSATAVVAVAIAFVGVALVAVLDEVEVPTSLR
jgi:hypothetical protein